MSRYVLGERAAKWLRQQLQQGNPLPAMGPTFRESAPPIRLFQAPVDGVPARASQTPGKASCSVVVTDDATGALTVSTLTFDVYNWVKQAVCTSGDRYGVAVYTDGRYWVIADDCGDA